MKCFAGKYFLILTLIVFFMLLYVYIGGTKVTYESFYQDYPLLAPEKTVVVQGLGVPDIPVQPTEYDPNDLSAPTVDGTEKAPKSKFLFAYNECKPECCATSGGYACNGGCPCITDAQKQFMSRRGFNSNPQKCAADYTGI